MMKEQSNGNNRPLEISFLLEKESISSKQPEFTGLSRSYFWNIADLVM